jgi:signal transduction histidine kinase/DNA-binding response OmpR family regulator/predicted RNA-binding protein with RPS1 domain
MDKKRNLVRVRVIKQLPQGLSVTVENGGVGIIRVREISWNEAEIAKWKASYPVGWEGYAFSIPSRKGEAREFSLRLAERDPWDEFRGGFDKDRIYEGVVNGVFDYGAFIEIAPGVTGLLHKSQIPSQVPLPATELFWYADKVLVKIREADDEQRQVGLSLAYPDGRPSETLPGADDALPPAENSRAQTVFDLPIPRRRILLVMEDRAQSEVVTGWLRDMGQSVDPLQRAEDGLSFLARALPHLALIDLGVSGAQGADLARRIRENYPQVQVVLLTDWARLDELKREIEELQAQDVKLLYKPLLPEDLAYYLLHEQEQRTSPILHGETLSLSDIPKLDAGKSIHSLLTTCRKRLGVEQAILFSFDPGRRSVHIVERAGEGFIHRSAVPQLIYSPVRDVAEDRKLVAANEITDRDRRRFQHLLEFCPEAVSCIGVPVPARSSMKYALFALDRRPKQFSPEIQMYVQGMALAVGAALDQEDLRQRTALLQRSALIGNVAKGMMHEIANLISPLYYEFVDLRRKIARVDKQPGVSSASVNDQIGRLQEDIRRIINTAKMFTRLTAREREEVLKIEDIIEETRTLLRDISDRANVRVFFDRPPGMVIARAPSAVLEQILLNVCLNAIQQIEEFRPGIRGWVKLSMEVLEDAPGKPPRCRVLVEDNGPGIHVRQWEKVFEAGYSTRREGSGIGLYISRSLIQEIGGEIYVLKSHILCGTTFALEFPVHL